MCSFLVVFTNVSGDFYVQNAKKSCGNKWLGKRLLDRLFSYQKANGENRGDEKDNLTRTLYVSHELLIVFSIWICK